MFNLRLKCTISHRGMRDETLEIITEEVLWAIGNTVKQLETTTQMFDYAAIADWLRTVIWSKDSLPTEVVIPAYGISTFLPTICKSWFNEKDTN